MRQTPARRLKPIRSGRRCIDYLWPETRLHSKERLPGAQDRTFLGGIRQRRRQRCHLRAAGLGGIDALAINNRSRRAGVAPDPFATCHHERVVHPLKAPVAALASAPHQRPEPRGADIATGKARTRAKLAPVRPHASNDKCCCQDGDDEHQQSENLLRIHGDLAFHAGDKLPA
jgi:hypothetical protein